MFILFFVLLLPKMITTSEKYFLKTVVSKLSLLKVIFIGKTTLYNEKIKKYNTLKHKASKQSAG